MIKRAAPRWSYFDPSPSPGAPTIALHPDGGRITAERILDPALLEGCRQATQRLGGARLTSVGVTSALRGEGRTGVAAGLALVQWLDHERRTVVVDLDIDRPALHKQLLQPLGSGVSELVDSHASIEDHLVRVIGDLWLLPAGRSSDDTPRILSRLSESAAMAQLMEWAEVLIFDLPPLLGSATGLQAARLCSTNVLVARAGITPLPRIREAVALLDAEPMVILNDTHSAMPGWLRRALGDWA